MSQQETPRQQWRGVLASHSLLLLVITALGVAPSVAILVTPNTKISRHFHATVVPTPLGPSRIKLLGSFHIWIPFVTKPVALSISVSFVPLVNTPVLVAIRQPESPPTDNVPKYDHVAIDRILLISCYNGI
ncbi:MAG: hypothetical protein ACOYET_01350 [Bacillota bacterium]|jgi:hypothetical protein